MARGEPNLSQARKKKQVAQKATCKQFTANTESVRSIWAVYTASRRCIAFSSDERKLKKFVNRNYRPFKIYGDATQTVKDGD